MTERIRKCEAAVVLRELVALHDMPYDPHARGAVAREFQTRQNRAWDAARRSVVESDGDAACDVQAALADALFALREHLARSSRAPARLMDAADIALRAAGRIP